MTLIPVWDSSTSRSPARTRVWSSTKRTVTSRGTWFPPLSPGGLIVTTLPAKALLDRATQEIACQARTAPRPQPLAPARSAFPSRLKSGVPYERVPLSTPQNTHLGLWSAQSRGGTLDIGSRGADVLSIVTLSPQRFGQIHVTSLLY